MTITAARLRELLNYDPATGVFTRRQGSLSGRKAGSYDHGYWSISVDCKEYYAHRLAWLYVTGEWPKSKIDHKDCDRGNNRFDNLREASDEVNSQNLRAAQSNNGTGFLGVSKKRNRFEARIFRDRGLIRLGVFDTPEQAHAAYIAAKRVHHEGCTI